MKSWLLLWVQHHLSESSASTLKLSEFSVAIALSDLHSVVRGSDVGVSAVLSHHGDSGVGNAVLSEMLVGVCGGVEACL